MSQDEQSHAETRQSVEELAAMRSQLTQWNENELTETH